jgi:hypothetical protein
VSRDAGQAAQKVDEDEPERANLVLDQRPHSGEEDQVPEQVQDVLRIVQKEARQRSIEVRVQRVERKVARERPKRGEERDSEVRCRERERDDGKTRLQEASGLL